MTGWPHLLELDVGESAQISLPDGVHTLTLRGVEHAWAPDYWITDNPTHRTLRRARVWVEVDGDEAALSHRPYQMPTEIGALRLYIETTKRWATACNLAPLPIEKSVRVSVQPRGVPWSPVPLHFPILNYRWRAASYNNTWSALVPYNKLYYHRGEDFGAIPDRLPVIAVIDGEITASPVPSAAGSNGISLRSPEGLTVRYAHMNIETMDPDLEVGTQVTAGQVLGKTGCTWNGWRSQHADPHLHVGFGFSRSSTGTPMPVSPYPFLVEAIV